jgi:peptidoglycan hydrolase CwlO-like protein
MNFFKRLFTNKKKLIEELEKTKKELSECGNKLVEKQEHINATNSYWKKKMYALKAQTNKQKDL